MKAMLLEEPRPVVDRPLRFTEIATSSPAPNEVLIKIRACGVCRTDLHIVEGELEVRARPLIPGHQIVGEIAGLGNAVRERFYAISVEKKVKHPAVLAIADEPRQKLFR